MAIQIRGSQIKNATITNDQISASAAIADTKLATIASANKVSGSALQLAGSSGLENNSGIRIAAGGVTDAMLAGSISFTKLADNANIARLDQTEAVAAVWSFGNNLPTVTADPSSANQLARKSYVDSVSQGLDVKDSVRVATTANGALASAYANGSAVDGVTLATGNRILLKDQTNKVENGIYTVNASGTPTRASDFAAGSSEAGAFTFVEDGTTQADSGWVCTANKGSDVVGTNNLDFSQFSGAGQITAGAGLTKTGNTLDVVGTADKITVSANAVTIAATYIGQNTITTLGTIATGTWNADVLGENKIPALTVANKVEGSAVQRASDSAIENFTGLRLKANLAGNGLGLTSSGGDQVLAVGAGTGISVNAGAVQIAANYGGQSSIVTVGTIGSGTWQGTAIADNFLGTIAAANKVSGSAVQLAATSAIENATGLKLKSAIAGNGLSISNQVLTIDLDGTTLDVVANGLKVKAGGITNNEISNTAGIALSKLGSINAGQILVGPNGNGAPTAVAMSGDVTISDTGATTIGNNAITPAKLAALDSGFETFPISNGTTAAVQLAQDIVDANFRGGAFVQVFINGMRAKFSGSPGDNSEYSVASSGGNTTVTFGANLVQNDSVMVSYIY